MLTLDNLAHRYHCLPSEALARANTFDLMILDLGAKWHNHQSNSADGTQSQRPKLTTEEMLEMIKKARA
jgi:hypothetical protein